VGIYKNLTTIRLRIALAFIFIISVVFLNLKYNNEAASRYPLLFYGKEAKEKDVGLAWQWIYKNTSGGKRIAYTGRGEFYPLFGQGLVNDVFYVSVNDKFPLAHHYPDGLYRKEKDEATWLNNLKKKNVELLFVYLPHEENIFPIENDWAEKNKDKFKLVFENSKVKIFSVSIN
jgi:hypothetical protein